MLNCIYIIDYPHFEIVFEIVYNISIKSFILSIGVKNIAFMTMDHLQMISYGIKIFYYAKNNSSIMSDYIIGTSILVIRNHIYFYSCILITYIYIRELLTEVLINTIPLGEYI